MGSSLLRAVRALLAVLAVLAVAAPAVQARSLLRVKRVPGGAVATYVGRPAGGVVFVLDGGAVARDGAPPYVVRVRVVGGRALGHRLAVRTLRTGRLLAARTLVAGPPAAAPRASRTTPPAIALTTAPGAAGARTALVAWRTVPGSGAVACTLDGRVLRTCRSPLWLRSLRPGRHTVTVRVRTAGGSAGTAAAFVVRRAAAGLAIGDAPPAQTTLGVALVSFAGASGATTCALDGAAPQPCTSPVGYAGLRRGAHALVVRDARGRSATAAWSVVAPRRSGMPSVALVDRPASGSGRRVVFTWTSAVAARTTCTLDGRARACTSPQVLAGLKNGHHRLVVTVRSARGAVSAAYAWTVGRAPILPVGAGPACGTRASGPGAGGYAHVVWIVMENHGFSDVLDPSSAPYTSALAARCGSATDFHAETHPSLPNYVAMTSGDTQGVTDDADPSSHPLGVPSIFSLAGDWRALEDAMPAPCAATSSGTYAVRHNPPAYYTGLAADCAARDVPLGATPDLSARFTFVTPDLCHDTHDCSVTTGDTWLAGFLPKVFASPQYREGSTAVFLTWDENDGGGGNQIALLAMAPSVPKGRAVATTANHYALLRTTEELLGLAPLLGQAATAPSLVAPFNF